MLSKVRKLHVSLFLLLVALVVSAPAFAGSAVIGSVAGSMNATIGGQALVPSTTVFSGDSLQVQDGVAVVAIGRTSRMVFGRETIASFLRDADDVTVLLGQGNVSMYHPDDTVALLVKAGDISIAPAKGFKTLGEIAMLDGAVVVTTKEGLLRVEGNGPAIEVAKGRTITIQRKAARAPAGAAAGTTGARISGSAIMGGVSVAASGLGAVMSGVALKRAGDAKTAATNAAATAQTAATSAAAAATAATNAVNAANAAGCAVDVIANKLGFASPIVPKPPGCIG